LAVVHNGEVAIGADGQATMGATVAKNQVKKIRKMLDGKIVTGFAGSTADAFTLLERFEEKLNAYGGNMKRASIELAKDWRTDRYLRKLEACGLVKRFVHPVVPPQVDYSLTLLGETLLDPLAILYEWSESHVHELNNLE